MTEKVSCFKCKARKFCRPNCIKALLFSAMRIKCINSGAHSPDPFDPIQKFLMDILGLYTGADR